jgi:hypothetical protein
MMRRKAKAAPKAALHRHAKKPGWKRKLAAQVFTSLLAPLLVGLALQTFQARRAPSQPPRTSGTSVTIVPAPLGTSVPVQPPQSSDAARPVSADADERVY